ncbi:MAG: flavin reductase [Lautropia sp.]
MPDPILLRHCLSRFATGVTIVATRDDAGRPVGLTANSFNSLSLAPPLILWSLGDRAGSLPVFRTQPRFSVSVLAVEQVGLARRFASKLADRFEGVAFSEGLDGLPLIDGALAWFECERRSESHHGDHWLFTGEVLRCATADGSPLVFRHGEFATAGPLGAKDFGAGGAAGATGTRDLEPGERPFYEEYLPYLLSRAGHQISAGFERQLRAHGLNLLSWRVLASLATRDEWSVGELCEVCLAKQPTVSKLLDRLEASRLVTRRHDPRDARRVLVRLSPGGRKRIAPILEDAAAFNLSVLASYPPQALTAMKHLLRDMIGRYPPAPVDEDAGVG